jgi:hypothetical protein
MLLELRLHPSAPIVPGTGVENLSEMKFSSMNPSAFKDQMTVLANLDTILKQQNFW